MMTVTIGAIRHHFRSRGSRIASFGDLICDHAEALERDLAERDAQLAEAHAEVERLRAALAEAEERAAGPFFATCDDLDHAEYGRRLEDVMDRLCERAAEVLEDGYEPEEWARTVARWECAVAHGALLAARLDEHGDPCTDIGSAAGWWDYDLRLTVTPDGQPVLTAERRAGGAR